MEEIKISDYLKDLDKKTRRGTCKSCQMVVQWTNHALASHKRASCKTVSEDDKKKFVKRRTVTYIAFNG